MTLAIPLVGLTACAESSVPTEMPLSPIHLTQPFAAVKDRKQYTNAQEFEKLLAQLDYTLDGVRQFEAVPPVFATNLPPNLAKLTTEKKTSTFIRLLLPNVVKANEDIGKVRAELTRLQKKTGAGETLAAEETKWLEFQRSSYGIAGDSFADLLARIDAVPVAMVLAQGIDESGWGTSRFAIEGNALFGQHLSGKNGNYMTSGSGNVKVAAFNSVYHSVASYMHNLNTSRAYAGLREMRAKLRHNNEAVTGNQLVNGLVSYSSRGSSYVKNLQSIISHHKLDALDAARLSSEHAAMLVTFAE